MNEVQKSIGLSLAEYQFLMSVAGIEETFQYGNSEMPNEESNIDEILNRTMVNLYQRGILEACESGFEISKEMSSILRAMLGYTCVLVIGNPIKHEHDCVIYYAGNEGCSIVGPGRRDSEYAIVTHVTEDDLLTTLKEEGLITDSVLDHDLVEFCEMVPLVGELSNGDVNADRLMQSVDVEICYAVYISDMREPKAVIAQVKQPFQDKLLVCENGNVEMYIYTGDTLIGELERIIQ